MKLYSHTISHHAHSSFTIRHDIQANFGPVWHYHPELELHYVVKGEGVRFIGDNQK